MTTIQVKNMSFTYNGSFTPVFEQVSFNIDTRWRLGFTGRNGRGKTTFMRLLLGEGPSRGTLTGRIEHSTVFDYFPFAIAPEDSGAYAYEVVGRIYPDYAHWALVKEMNLLQLEETVLYRPYGSLSPGEQTKLQLAVLFLKANHFLLIDEPTNHLDRHGRDCVANYLSKKSGFLLVSHDRAFLDQCIDHVLSIQKTKIVVHQGNYATYLENKARQDAYETAENQKLTAGIRALGEAIQRTRGWSDQVEAGKIGSGPVDRGYIGAKSEKMMKRALAIEKRRERSLEDKKKLMHDIEAHQPLEIKIAQPTWAYKTSDKPLLQVTDFSLGYGALAPVISDLNFELYWGERVVITGGNGAGKSTLLKVLAQGFGGNEANVALWQKGLLVRDNTHIVSYVSQDARSLKGSLRHYILARGIDEGLFKSMLHKLDFETLLYDRPMEHYSEGQRKKVLLAASLCERAHIYIWDEPLNYIDVISRAQIEAAILQYQPTLIFVEHDSAFCDRVSTRSFNLSRQDGLLSAL